MKTKELLRLVALNINQNKFKSVMTSIGIVVGAATIVLVIGIGRGGQKEVAEQFAELNAGAIDVSYEYAGEETGENGFSFGGIVGMFGGMFGGDGELEGVGPQGGFNSVPGQSFLDGSFSGGNFPGGELPENGKAGNGFPGGDFSGRDFPGGELAENGEVSQGDGKEAESEVSNGRKAEDEGSIVEERLNQEEIVLAQRDVEDIERYVQGISGATISYSTQASIEGANLTSAKTYTIAGVKESYKTVSKLELSQGTFLTEGDDDTRSRVCVLGATVAKELFGREEDIENSTLYIDGRAYTIGGVLEQTSAVSAGISPDTTIFIPYETGIKYVTGKEISPVITVIAKDVNVLDSVIESVKKVLEENYSNAEFTFEDSGSKMEAAQSSNQTLTMLLSAMAAIVFLVGGIGIMNVLFVSVKERTNEIGILKAIGTSRHNILVEFLIESAAISCIGGSLGIVLSFGVIPVVQYFDVRIEVTVFACAAALGFAVLTGTVFGLYPAWKASRLEPVDALNAE